jgi:DNA-binding CsgD family transcriptional regulator
VLLDRPRARRLKKLVTFLERGVISLGDLDEMLESVCALYDGAAIALTQTPDFVGPGHALRLPAAWPTVHLRYQHQDPIVGFLAERPPGSTFSVESDQSPAARELELYTAFRGLGFGDGLVTKIHSPFSEVLYLAIYRERGSKRVSAEDRMLVRLLHPHLAGALAAKCALSHFRAANDAGPPPRGQAFASVAISYPTLRVDWTRAAKEFVRRRLGASGNREWRRVERMLVRAAERFDRFEVGGRSQVLVPGIRVELANVPPHADERRRVIALLVDDRAAPTFGQSPAEELLSGRQRDVARAAARGCTTQEIADELGMSVETARWHLKAIFDKLGITRRAELTRLLG